MKVTKILFVLFSFFLLFSCSRTKEYRFTVTNETDYTLNSVMIGWCNGDNKKLLIPPHSTSEEFTLEYKVGAMNVFAPGSLCMNVLSYSDSTTTYENTYGKGRDRGDLEKVNSIVIKLDNSPYYPSDIFLFE